MARAVGAGDRFRRAQPALWARHGTAQAINAGDLCIALAYAAIAAVPVADGVRWQLTITMTRAARRIVEGQAAELGLLSSILRPNDSFVALAPPSAPPSPVPRSDPLQVASARAAPILART